MVGSRKSSLVFWGPALLAVALASGCPSKPQPQADAGVNSSGSQANSDVKDAKQNRNALYVDIDNLLARKNLPEKARKLILERKNRGVKKLLKQEIDAFMRLAAIKPPHMAAVVSLFVRGPNNQVKLPSWSKLKQNLPKVAPENSPDPIDELEYLRGRSK